MTFKRPDWLDPEPQGRYDAYSPGAQDAWEDIPWGERRGRSLWDAHVDALAGNTHCLRLMRQFYLACVTKRLKT